MKIIEKERSESIGPQRKSYDYFSKLTSPNCLCFNTYKYRATFKSITNILYYSSKII